MIIDNFRIDVVTHTITLTVGEHGSVTPSGENGIVTVGDGADVSFTITPDAGYQIDALVVDGSPLYCDPAGETYTFNAVTGDHTISVVFGVAVSADLIETGSLSIYPNPNNGMFSINFSNIEGDATCQLIDVRGVVIDTRDINVMDGETMTFNYNLRAGAYFVRVISGDKVYVNQIVVE
ncbi:MAG: T9SS type A sorting domain-containing protein [Bacteroidales bacterium]|nr:T9SS type A sorting domain-containing protein [Bacteroidales bacterium]